MTSRSLTDLLTEIRQCRHCNMDLPLGPRPILRAASGARIILIGQAPGTRVHQSGIPWNDPSGDRLRRWLDLDKDMFYDQTKIAIIPMGFCYPGKGKAGDLPPRPECAPLWHRALWSSLPDIRLALLIGRYAIDYYLKPEKGQTLASIVRGQSHRLFRATPHPSPRNIAWFKQNPWFEREAMPAIRNEIKELLR